MKWVPLIGYPGYEICKEGFVRSIDRVNSYYRNNCTKVIKRLIKGRVLAFKISHHNYKVVNISLADQPTKTVHEHFLHRLLAKQFIPNPNGYTSVNHKDGNKQNNSLSNLEWCTPSQNVQHAWRIGLAKSRRGVDSHAHKLNEAEVLRIRELIDEGGLTHEQIATLFNMSRRAIGQIGDRSTWAHL